jgi:hypothetical protein
MSVVTAWSQNTHGGGVVGLNGAIQTDGSKELLNEPYSFRYRHRKIARQSERPIRSTACQLDDSFTSEVCSLHDPTKLRNTSSGATDYAAKMLYFRCPHVTDDGGVFYVRQLGLPARDPASVKAEKGGA